MGTISASKITAALQKARDIGVSEEPLTIEDVALVLRNLRPDHYSAIYTENKEKEGIEHVFSFQKSHLCRSIVEINGVDLRDVDYVEVEEEIKDPKTQEPVIDPATGQPKTRKVKLERHVYVRQYVLDGWTKEPIQIAWRKFGDVLKLAEDKAKDGVKFVLPEMSPEERLREAIGNVREVIDDVPSALVDSILEEAGLIRISTADEIKRAMEKAEQITRDIGATGPQPQQQAQAPQEVPQQQAAPVAPQPVVDPRVRQPTVQEIEEMMARRNPMNREAVSVPSTQVQPAMASPQATHQMPPQGLPQNPQVPAADQMKVAKRAQMIARMEGEGLDLEVPVPPPGDPSMVARHIQPGSGQGTPVANAPHLQRAPEGVGTVLQKGRDKVDMQAFDKIVNKPPPAGINPRFRPVR